MNDLEEVLKKLAEDGRWRVKNDGYRYLVAKLSESFEYYRIGSGEEYADDTVMIPVYDNFVFMPIQRFPASDFEGRVQLHSGLVVDRHIADATEMDYKLFEPQEYMSLCGLPGGEMTLPRCV